MIEAIVRNLWGVDGEVGLLPMQRGVHRTNRTWEGRLKVFRGVHSLFCMEMAEKSGVVPHVCS